MLLLLKLLCSVFILSPVLTLVVIQTLAQLRSSVAGGVEMLMKEKIPPGK